MKLIQWEQNFDMSPSWESYNLDELFGYQGPIQYKDVILSV